MLIGLIVLLLLIGIIGSASGSGKESKPAASNDTTAATSATSAASTTTEAPTTTLPPPTTTAILTPITLQGTGNRILDVPAHDGPMIVHVIALGSSNFVIYALDASLEEGDLVANAIAPYQGTVPLDFTGSTTTRKIKIEAEGSYTLEFKDPRLARRFDTTITGANDEVVIYAGKTGILDYSNTGTSNFTAYYYASDSGEDLLINDIGPITGQTTIQEGPAFIVVSGEGSWTLTVKPA